MGAGDEMGLARRLESFGVDLAGIDENDALALRRLMLGIPALAAAAVGAAPGDVNALMRNLPASATDPPALVGAPTITRVDAGGPVVGATVALHLGAWTGPPPLVLSGVLLRDATPILSDMTADQTYVLAVEDIGALLRLDVTASNGDEWRLAQSATYGPVVAATALIGTEDAPEGYRRRRRQHEPRDV